MYKNGADREPMLRGEPMQLPTLQVQMLATPVVQQLPPGAGGLLEYGSMLGGANG